ncbi:MAG: peptidyl-tRNA hydrolase, family [Candidatus Marinimicrobia bacterium]|nr:peptidyl-tRNA hydrolase, family [Candidatus Neomarinimicrobiota bacterium]
MKVIVGLGNPGKKYAQTRHNLGFMVLDELANRHGLAFKSGRGAYLESRMSDGSLLVKPMSFMNLSGQALADVSRRYPLNPGETLLIHDDLDVDFGRLKIRPTGSAGGHNGLKSIFGVLGTQDIPRIKIGINTPERRQTDAEIYVLKPFLPEEWDTVKEMVQKAADAVELFLKEDLNTVMNRYNRLEKEKDSESVSDGEAKEVTS